MTNKRDKNLQHMKKNIIGDPLLGVYLLLTEFLFVFSFYSFNIDHFSGQSLISMGNKAGNLSMG
jgi:cytochrome c oxidase subunit IV